MKKWITELKEDENGDIFVELPDDLLNAAGFIYGDVLDISYGENGSIILKKKNSD